MRLGRLTNLTNNLIYRSPCCLASDSELLLLDEPVAGIAPGLSKKIVETIGGLPEKGKTVILIEHNIDVVMNLTDWVVFMDAGAKICEGKPDDVRNNPLVIEAYLD